MAISKNIWYKGTVKHDLVQSRYNKIFPAFFIFQYSKQQLQWVHARGKGISILQHRQDTNFRDHILWENMKFVIIFSTWLALVSCINFTSYFKSYFQDIVVFEETHLSRQKFWIVYYLNTSYFTWFLLNCNVKYQQ